MTSISEIARDPGKALKRLENDLGVKEGTLMREMRERALEIGDWTQHIPYSLAAGYYDNSATRERYQSHVDWCTYCQHLLESLHPSDLQAAAFVKTARRASPARNSRPSRFRSIPLAIVASVLITAAASLFVVPSLQTAGMLDGQTSTEAMVANLDLANLTLLQSALATTGPDRLAQLQASKQPAERFLAAKYYFAANKPELAYQELGEGLQLAGLHGNDAHRITTVSNLLSDKSAAAADLTNAIRQLPRLQANAQSDDPSDFLDVAQAQAKLGLHKQALESIARYLQTQHVDPKILADFSALTAAKAAATEAEAQKSDSPP